MSRTNWIRWGLYAASFVAGVFGAIFPVALPVLAPVSAGLAGLATRTPGDAPETATAVGPAASKML